MLLCNKSSSTFLSRCVPDRELQPLPLQRHHLQLEIHSYCRRQIVKGVGCETEKQTALTDSRIADQEHLQEMIELPSRLLPPSLFAQNSNAYTFGSLFSFLFFFLCFFTENQKLSTNPSSSSSSPRIKSFPQILSLQFLDSRSVLFRLFPR